MTLSFSTTTTVLALAFVLWGTVATPLPATGGCATCFPTLDSTSELYSENYYLSASFKTNWHKALQFCLLHGMSLAAVENKNENDEVISLLKRNDVASAWIGLSDLAEDGRYNKVTDGHYEQYAQWAAGQPDHASKNRGHCVAVQASESGDGKVGWFNADCGTDNSFVCSRRPATIFVG